MTSRLHVMSSVIGMVSPTGACRVMDANADGFVHGEGCGVIALKRLSDAINDGDRIHAVIRGSAINHDGRTLGLTAPNADAQEQVIRVALERANLTPADVQYVELHGSGTPLGDPCEFDALRRAFSAHPSTTPCALGSVKTNIGHTIAAAGVAGTIRGIMAMKHGMLPANPWLTTLNPNVQLQGTRFVIPTQPTEWPRGAAPRRAGVSSFGASGTNAHVVLEQAPVVQRQSALRSNHALLLSAPDAQSLTAVRERWAEFLSDFEGDIADVCFTAACHRTHHRQRAAVLGRDASELALALRTSAPPSQLEPRLPPRIGIVFGSMQRAQDAWTGTGSCALTVASTVERATHALETRRRGAPSPVTQALIRSGATQLGVGLALRELGVEPWLCMGSGSGVLAAACFDDVISLEQIVEAALALERENVETRESELALAVAQVIAPTWLRQQQVNEGTVVAGEGARSAGTERASTGPALSSCAVWLGVADTLSPAEKQALGAEQRRALPCHSPEALLQIAVELHCLGTEIDWRRLLTTGNIVDLPRYPWQRRLHWAIPARAGAHVSESPLSTSASTVDARETATPPSLVAVIA
ncbi:MAG TPA: type I polyketide synthase, partial [Polyangiaceae bacterium]|nr:type I polyketide synthase [Polyangiaceae bacterium]